MRRPLVEIFYFEGCLNHEPARALVERISAQLRVAPKIELVEVPDADAAKELQFLGSPTVRVNGRDVEPGADRRGDYVFSCRLYWSEHGCAGHPEEGWIREALREAAA
ncbi:MAG: DF family (seleno)protein [Gaiellaceae bacterium]